MEMEMEQCLWVMERFKVLTRILNHLFFNLPYDYLLNCDSDDTNPPDVKTEPNCNPNCLVFKFLWLVMERIRPNPVTQYHTPKHPYYAVDEKGYGSPKMKLLQDDDFHGIEAFLSISQMCPFFGGGRTHITNTSRFLLVYEHSMQPHPLPSLTQFTPYHPDDSTNCWRGFQFQTSTKPYSGKMLLPCQVPQSKELLDDQSPVASPAHSEGSRECLLDSTPKSSLAYLDYYPCLLFGLRNRKVQHSQATL